MPASAAGAVLEAHGRASAAALEAQQRWGEAAAYWEMLALMRPEDAALAPRAAEARARGRAVAIARFTAGAQARARGDFDAATREFVRALSADPDHLPATQALREIESERARRSHLARGNRTSGTEMGFASRTGNRSAPAMYADVRELDEGVTFFQRGEYEASIQALQAYLQRFPLDEESRRYLRDALVRVAQQRHAAGKKEEALVYFERARAFGDRNASDVAPAVESLRSELAEESYQLGLRERSGDPRKAIAAWEKALQYDPSHALAKRELEQARRATVRAPAASARPSR